MKGAIPDLDWVAWQDRKVVIAYDADAVIKALCQRRSELAAHLRSRAALVGFLEWDVTKGKGIDDHLALSGRTESWTKSPTSTSRVRRGERTYYRGNRL